MRLINENNTCKAILAGTTRTYYKTYEYTSNGTYSIDVNVPCTANVILVGGGGGGTHALYALSETEMWIANNTGGSGALITGSTSISAGTYSIVVGNAGNGNSSEIPYPYPSSPTYAGAGGDTTAFGNTAGGGGGAWSHAGLGTDGADGSGGTATVVSSGLTSYNGTTGSTTSRYANYGGGGSGGGGQGVGPNNGQNGYVKIILSSTREILNYDSYKDTYTLKGFN